MNELITSAPPRNAAEYKAALDHLFQEMQRLDERMAEDRVAIQQLQAEAQTIGAHTDAILEQLQRQLNLLQQDAKVKVSEVETVA